jgi:hypothetical protein
MNARSCAILGTAMLAATVLAPRPAHALDPLVRVTDCQPVEIAGHAAQRVTLAIAGQLQFFDTAVFLPTAAAGNDTCSIVDYTPPPGWLAFRGDRGAVLFTGPPVALGQALNGFVLTFNDVSCCMVLDLENFLLLDSAGNGVACFRDCLATLVRGASWGQVKAIYR